MDVWITWCKKKCKCLYCEQPITAGQPMVKCKSWRQGKWSIFLRFHPQCWIEQGLAKLRERPYEYTPRNAGRPKLVLPEAQLRQRYLILRRRAAIMQRRRQMATDPAKVDKISGLDGQLDNLFEEIKDCGGVPKSWK